MMKRVAVNKIIPFSSVDGTGNRTAVFLQGCNIDCKYCHNPETRKLCTNCGQCVKVCPAGALTFCNGTVHYDASKCVQCDACQKSCPHSSTPKTRQMSAEEVFLAVKKQIPFIRGVTVSGGECMLQTEFLTELFSLCKQAGLHTLIDSNGTVDFENYPQLLNVTDGVMLDIKAFDEADHIAVTSHTNKAVLKNAVFLAQQNKLSEVRCVIVPDLYDVEKNLEKTCDFLAPLLKSGSIKIKLIPYRPMGVRQQYKNMVVPTGEHMKRLENIFRKRGFSDIVII